jgi:hypothetical protein
MTVRCESCGQTAWSPDGRPIICPACTAELEHEHALEHAYEMQQLFRPAPAPMAGQTTMEGC